MRSLIKQTVCVLVLAVTAIKVHSADVIVTGFYDPGSCTPSFSNGGTIDYGLISIHTLKANEFNVLPERQIHFAIVCTRSQKVGFKLTSQRVGTLLQANGEQENTFGFGLSPVPLLGFSAEASTGLGLDRSQNKIGGMAMNITQGATIVDGDRNVALLQSSNGGSDYSLKANESFLTAGSDQGGAYQYTWGDQGSDVAKAFMNAIVTVNVQAYLNKLENLDLSDLINIDGAVTFEMVYL
nr:DUF1120 domain-containing protein [Acinetobacter courvalinii]